MSFYAVAKGKNVGVFADWKECKKQVKGFSHASYKKFKTKFEAEKFIENKLNSNEEEENKLNSNEEEEIKLNSKVSKENKLNSKVSKENKLNSNEEEENKLNSNEEEEIKLNSKVSKENKLNSNEEEENKLNSNEEEENKLNSNEEEEIKLNSKVSKEIKLNSKVSKEGENFFVYTDGACSHNGSQNAKAGIGIYFGENDERNVSKRIIGKQTNNTAELTAIIETYKIIENDVKLRKVITIVSDSIYAIKCATSYGEKCSKNGYKKRNGTCVTNKELVKNAYEIYRNEKNVNFIHCMAHTKKTDIHSLGNACADRLANDAIGSNICPYIIKRHFK
jgi:ribonuclease HI